MPLAAEVVASPGAEGEPPCGETPAASGAQTPVTLAAEPLVAVAVETGASRCANCEAIQSGEYCAACGQRFEPPIRSIGAFTRDAFESITHADSRLWRTLAALLLKPGRLTREFLDGRRMRYLPPFRLYLVVSVLFFLLASLLGGGRAGTTGEEAVAPIVVGGAPASEAAADLAREAERMRTGDAAERAAGETLGRIAAGNGARDPVEACAQLAYEGPWKGAIEPRMRRACERALADGGRALVREFMANLPHTLFLFLPLIALVTKLMYWRPRRYYVEHLLFFVHNHAFAFLLFALVMLVTAPLGEGIGGLVTFAALAYVPWYFFRAMRVTYGESRTRTLFKYTALAGTYLVSGIVLTLATAAWSALSL